MKELCDLVFLSMFIEDQILYSMRILNTNTRNKIVSPKLI